MNTFRRIRPFIAVAILIYGALVGLMGGFDLMVGPVRLRSHHTDWLLRLAVIAAFAELVIRSGAVAAGDLVRYGRELRSWLRGVTRPLLIALVGVTAAMWFLGLLSRLVPVETPGGDMALLELYTRQATRGELLVGPYSRFQWHHPGPAMFYLASPLYTASGERFASLRVSALLLNIGCFLASLAVLRRHGGAALAFSTAITMTIFLYRANDVLVSPWNPHLLLLPLVLLLVCCAALMNGATSLSVAIVALASFLIQTHLSITPTVAVAVVTSILVAAARLGVTGDLQALRRAVNLSLWVGVIVWIPPLAEQITSAEGNLSRLYRFFTEPNFAPMPRESYSAFFRLLSGFMLPGFTTAWGGQQLSGVSVIGFVLSLTSLMALPWAASRLRARRNRVGATLSLLLLAVCLTALWSLLRIRGEVLDQVVFWITALGVLNVTCIVAGFSGDISVRLARRVSIVAVLLMIAVGTAELLRTNRPTDDPGAATRITTGSDAIASYLQREKVVRPLVYIAHATWGDAAGILLRLDKAGIDVSIERDWLYMFGERYAENRTEDSVLVFADQERRQPLLQQKDYVVLAEWPELTIFFAHAGATTHF